MSAANASLRFASDALRRAAADSARFARFRSARATLDALRAADFDFAPPPVAPRPPPSRCCRPPRAYSKSAASRAAAAAPCRMVLVNMPSGPLLLRSRSCCHVAWRYGGLRLPGRLPSPPCDITPPEFSSSS